MLGPPDGVAATARIAGSDPSWPGGHAIGEDAGVCANDRTGI
jgi:hypothetical protein